MNIEQRINKYFIVLVSHLSKMCFPFIIFLLKKYYICFLCEFENTMLQSFVAVFIELFKELFKKNTILFNFEIEIQ